MDEKPQKQALGKTARQKFKDEILNWLSQQPQQKVANEAFLDRIGGAADLNLFLSDSRVVKFEQSGQTWFQTTQEYLRQYKQRKREISYWLSALPEAKVQLDEFTQFVDHSLQLQHLLTKGEFTVMGSAGKWVKMTPKNEVHCRHLLSAAQVWLSQKSDHKAKHSDFAAFINSAADLKYCLADKQFVTFTSNGQKWVQTSAQNAIRQGRRLQEIHTWLLQKPDQLVTRGAFASFVDNDLDLKFSLQTGDFVELLRSGEPMVQLKSSYEAAENNLKANSWADCLALCGETQRPDSKNATSDRQIVIARSYAIDTAARRVGLPAAALRIAITDRAIQAFIDPDNNTRVPASVVEEVLRSPEKREHLSGSIPLKVRHIALVSSISYSTLRSRLLKAGLSTSEPTWGQVRGLWGLPATYIEFKTLLDERYPLWLETTIAQKASDRSHQAPVMRRSEAQENLRRQLLEVFPTWEGSEREDQRIILHIGQTNSGKTHHGLNHLIRAGSGWYLSPLRLLAHEVYERLNRSGVPCNLLTGEEAIPVGGARITAATIEMFNASQSGACVLIDEAHMLADSQRGWAWTRALMETKSPEIHVLGSPVAETLVNQMAEQIGVPVDTNEYERLVPLDTAESPWSLAKLPPRTILVAFSRHMVLGLKTELEKSHRRSVSVIYGNLPPEVRLRQAERFANGETEICVATDAIGMGLNLPADNVCFYETQKYDGQEVRTLTDHEITQIGGRAGRYGLSQHGLIGALNEEDLAVIRNAIHQQTENIVYAYVAPSPASIALLPGRLADKLQTWVNLQGIPDRWRQLLKPVDLANQINLARQLSDKDIAKIGEETAMQLINAPCDQNTEVYWRSCAESIIHELPMPMPENPPAVVRTAEALVSYERAIRCADIYLWLSQRRPFAPFGQQAESLRTRRNVWTMQVDAALQQQIDTGRRCSTCGRPLALHYRFKQCERCFRQRRGRF